MTGNDPLAISKAAVARAAGSLVIVRIVVRGDIERATYFFGQTTP
jgi:hypothetical protein